MNDLMFLQMIFNGYVNCYGHLRWHTQNTYSDMTQKELNFFSNLGSMLGFLSIREKSERARPENPTSHISNPRDLVWVSPERPDDVILHIERENDCAKANACFFTDNKILDSAKYGGDRFLVAVLGHVRDADYQNIKKEIVSNPVYLDRKVLIISFIGQTRDNARECRGLIKFENRLYERTAKAELDKGGYWYLYFMPESVWQLTV